MILTIYDRYSNNVYHCNSKTLFIIGQNIGVIRKSNMECVDIFDKNGIRKTWYCLEYVLKYPEIFKPLLICNIGMVDNKEFKTFTCKNKLITLNKTSNDLRTTINESS